MPNLFPDLYENPQFQSLDYDQQVEARMILLKRKLETNPNFAKLYPHQQSEVLRRLAFKPPALQDKNLERSVNDLSQQVIAGSEDAQKRLFALRAMERVNVSTGLVHLVNKKLISPMLDEIAPLAETEEMRSWHLTGHPEKTKIFDYFDYLGSLDKQRAKTTRTALNVIGIGANIAEIVGLALPTAGTWAFPMGAGKIATNLASRISSVAAGSRAANMITRFGQLVGHGIIEGSVGVAREHLKAHLNDTAIADPSFREVAQASGEYFRDYFLWDVLTNTALSVILPSVGMGLKAFDPRIAQKQWMDNLTNQQFDDIMRRTVTGERLPPEVVELIPDDIKPWLDTLRATGKTHRFVRHAKREEILQMVGGKYGFATQKLDDGMIHVFGNVGKKGTVEEITTLKNWDDYENFLIDRVQKLEEGAELGEKHVGALSTMEQRVGLREELKGKLSATSAERVDTAIQGIAPVGGKYHRGQVQGFGEFLLKQSEASSDLKKSFSVIDKNEFYKVVLGGEEIARFPKYVSSQVDEIRPLRQMITAVEEKAGVRQPGALVKQIQKSQPEPGEAFIEQTQKGWYKARYKEFAQPSAEPKVLWRKSRKQLYKELEDLGVQKIGPEETISKATLPPESYGTSVLRAYKQTLAVNDIITPTWARDVVRRHFDAQLLRTASGKWTISTLKGTQSFETLDDLGKWIISKTFPQEKLATYLKRYQGLYLRQTKDGKFVVETSSRKPYDVGYENKVVAQADTYEELINQNPHLIKNLPSELGPNVTFVKDGAKVTYSRSAAMGSLRRIYKHLDNFKGLSKKNVHIMTGTDGSYLKFSGKPQRTIEVFSAKTGDRKTFSSITKARNYLGEGEDLIKDAKYLAAKKGYRLDTAGGKYVLYTEDGHQIVANNLNDLSNQLSKAPIPEWAPELSGISEGLIEQIPKPPEGAFKPVNLTHEEITKLPPGKLIGAIYRPKDAFFEQVFRSTGDDFFINGYLDVENAIRSADIFNRQIEQVINTTFRRGGKFLDKTKREGIYEYVLATNKKAVIDQYNLTNADLQTARNIRKLFGENTDEGLFAAFDVDFEDFITDYLPRIRKYYEANPKTVYRDGEMNRFLKDAFQQRPPHRLKAFFKNQRVSAMIETSQIKDPMELLQRYAQIGYRQKILGPVWERLDREIAEGLKNNRWAKDQEALKVFQSYREMVFGINSRWDDMVLEFTNRVKETKLFQKLGLDTRTSQDMFDYMRSIGYFSAMGVRPWLVLRNVFQPWITVAPRVGNGYTAKAIRKVFWDKGDHVKKLAARGIVRKQLPVIGAEALQSGTGKANRLMRMLLTHYGRADDLNRAVSYTAFELMYDDALKKYMQSAKGAVAEQKFLENSGVKLFNPQLQERSKALIRNGQWDNAKDLLGKQFVDETQFVYRGSGKPEAFHLPVVGKLFGMFGTYPAYYVENIRRALRHGTTAQKAAYVGTFLGNTALLYEAFRNLGVNATNFLFWQPMTFTGGPFYHLMNQTIQSFSPYYEGRQYRAKVFGLHTKDGKISFDPWNAEIGKWIIPGGFQLRSMVEGIQALNDGEVYKAFLNFGSFPVNVDWFQEGLDEIAGPPVSYLGGSLESLINPRNSPQR
jgi:hypothetical protein